MNLQDLPDIQFVDTNPEDIQNAVITGFEAVSGKKLYPADPVRLFLLSVANLVVQQRVFINLTARQNLLRYASGDILDHMGAGANTQRNEGTRALTTVRFTLSAVQQGVTAVPLGTRVSPDAVIFFKTIANAQIPAGLLTADVLCECLEIGEVGNGFLPGQIGTIVDLFPYLKSVSNITTSSGGAERESDDHYRERIYMAPESYSVAGPEGAYRYWAKTANPDIIDVHVFVPAAGEVAILPLMVGGELPAPEVLDAVLAICNSKTIRPMTDLVSAAAPTQSSYNITFTYWISRDNEARATAVQTAVAEAVSEYIGWQKSALGRDINPDELRRLVLNAGAKRLTITAPAYTTLARTHVAKDATVTVTYGGIEDA